LVEDVIAIAVISKLLAQFLDSLFDLLGYRLSAWHGLDDGIDRLRCDVVVLGQLELDLWMFRCGQGFSEEGIRPSSSAS
jgi:hypothetical protein